MMTGYSLGKVLVHEMGHALGLYHTFSDATNRCDNHKRYPDIPEQLSPNFVASVEYRGGQWVQVNDNRDRELAGESDIRSCAKVVGQIDGQLSEQAVNYMDYARDPDSRMFTQSQVDVMRAHLVKHSNYTRESGVTTTNTTAAQSAIPEDCHDDTSDSSGLSTAAIVGIVIAAATLLVIIIGFLIWRNYYQAPIREELRNVKQQER
jgi:hypothetical protein